MTDTTDHLEAKTASPVPSTRSIERATTVVETEAVEPGRRWQLGVVTAASLLAVALAMAAALAVFGEEPLQPRPVIGALVLFVAFAVIERFPVHLETERGVFTWSAYEIPLTLALFYSPPTVAFFACVTGTAAVRISRRPAVVKLAFNTAATAVHTIAAMLLLRWFAERVGANDFVRLVLALLILAVLSVANVEVVAAVIRFTGGRVDHAAQRFARTGSLVAVGWSVSLSLAGVVILRERASALVFLVGLMVISYGGVRMFTTATQRILALRMLHDFSVRLTETSLVDEPTAVTLSHVRSVLRAERVEMLLFDGTHVACPRSEESRNEGTKTDKADERGPLLRVDDALVREVATRRRVLRLTRGEGRRRDSAHQRAALELAGLGLKDLMVAPLIRSKRVVGVLAVANRATATSTFSASDEALFETMAGHAMVTMENGDLIEKLKAEAALREHESLHDSLTGLANRALFNRRADDALATGAPLTVMLVDLNRFKEINDTLGHHVGDDMLRAVSERLCASLPADAVAARLGGDEFAIALPGVGDIANAAVLAEQMVRSVDEPLEAGGVLLALDLAIGVAVSGIHGADRTELLKCADVAMYSAKEHRRAAWALYEPEQERSTARHFSLVVDLRSALRRGDLLVHYQPRIDLRTGHVHGFEALARWAHPTLGMVPPDEFVPLAERSGLIFELTEVVMRTAFRDCARWQAAGIDAAIGINLSGRASLDQEFPALVTSAIAEAGLAASSVILEITEHELMNDAGATRRMLESLRAQGIAVAVDDFGTGHSSLAYLTSLPVDELKIDKGFVMRMQASPTEQAIVQAIVALGNSLGVAVVAEGVEDGATAAQLTSLGCRFAQGYHFARPMPVTDLIPWLSHREDVITLSI